MLRGKRIFCFVGLIYLVFVFGLYGNSLRGQFIWDDFFLISNNPNIKNLSEIPRLFTQDIGVGVSRPYGFFRPLQMVSFALDYFLWGGGVEGFHLTNILLHWGVCLCVFFLARLLFADSIAAFVAGLLFLAHPIQTETVAYISGRAESLAALFILLSLITYIRYQNVRKSASLYVSAFFYLAALLSKEYSVVLFFFIPFYHYVFSKKFDIRIWGGFLAITACYFLWRHTVLGGGGFIGFTPERIPGFFVAVAEYAFLLVWPMSLHLGYDDRVFSWGVPQVWVGAGIIGVLAYLSFRHRSRWVVFSSGWILLGLLPVSNIFVRLVTYMSEHWIYLPCVGLCLAAAKGGAELARRKGFTIWMCVAAFSVLCFWSVVTIRQNGYWRDPVAFGQRTLEYSPENTAILINLGIEYQNQGKTEEAARLFIKTLNILRVASVKDYNCGVGAVARGDFQEAIEFFKKAVIQVTYRPQLRDAMFKMGHVGLVNKVKELDNVRAQYYCNLAAVYRETGDHVSAEKFFKRARDIHSVNEGQCVE